MQAWTLYTKAATQCNDLLLLPESESNQPRAWKRVHGLLLGMRAAVEGAAASARAEASAVTAAAGVPSHTTSFRGRTEKGAPGAPRETAVTGGGAPGRNTVGREAGTAVQAALDLARFVADAGTAGEATQLASPSWPSATPRPFAPELAPSRARAVGPGHQATTEVPVGGSTTASGAPQPHPPPPPAATTGADVAFRFLSHRQAAVREAAIGLLHAQARSLGHRAALALFQRVVRALEHEQKKGPSNDEVGVTGFLLRAPATCLSPEDNPAHQELVGDSAAAAAAAAAASTAAENATTEVSSESGRDECGVEETVLGRLGAGASREPSSRAETRRRYDRIGGLLGLLERIVGQRGVLPSRTVGSSWERLFSALR